ncbi:BEN domain-containing protein 5-like [Dermacentor silvarum]|uniref:BEN domain-containing protein 5-like n=1 Tax=Dermacentor silvarum TaxID=543639 RepID=UPI0021010C05|nr:BEN domain-containing protein 5-like [Dermacentor silvarum]
MYALVRFLDHDHAHDTRRYVVRVDDIRDFHPEHETDFDGKAVYFVHWEDNVDSDNTGDYRAQILRLGATEKETREAPKRIPIPKMIIDEDFDDEESVPKKATGARNKKTVINRAAAKKDRYEQILKKQMNQALQKNSEQTRKRRLSSSSSSDDSLVSISELKEEKKKTNFWKERCKELRQDNMFLQEQVRSQQVLLNSKFLRFEDLQHSREPAETTAVCQATKETAKAKTNLVLGTDLPVRKEREMAMQGATPLAQTAGSHGSEIPIDDPAEEPASLITVSTARGGHEVDLSVTGEDFSYLSDGSFHLQRGICLTSIQAKRIFSHKKPTLVVKETAQAIWSQKGLASRSVKGGIAPRKKSLGEPAKPALTPEKVNIVEATLSHWARVNDLDSSAIAANLTNILSEKIQDCIKAERKRALNE